MDAPGQAGEAKGSYSGELGCAVGCWRSDGMDARTNRETPKLTRIAWIMSLWL